MFVKELHRNKTLEPSHARKAGYIHGPHATARDLGQQLIAAQHNAGPDRIVGRIAACIPFGDHYFRQTTTKYHLEGCLARRASYP